MVMGFKNSPQILHRAITSLLLRFKDKGVEIYADDIIIHNEDRSEHDKTVLDVIQCLLDNNFRINIEKLQVGLNEVICL
ncbi:NFX1-type zinc finger-containing protein 1, partial [Conglomerata obtusa]